MIKLSQKSVLSYFIQPFFILLLLSGIFSIIWLRSGIISMEYSISELENKKMDRLKETKTLLADRASALAMQRVEKTAARDLGLALADRTKVVYVKAVSNGPSRASLEQGYRGSRMGGDVPETGRSVSGGTIDGSKARRDVYNGGYQ